MNIMRRKNSGFSLIELLWVMIIGSVLMVAIYSVVFGSKNALLRGESDAQTSYRARRTMRHLVDDLRLAGYGLQGGTAGVIQGKENEITIVADIDKNGMLETIRYYLGDTTQLRTTPNPNDRTLYKSINGANPGTVLAVGLSSLTFGYYDGSRTSLLDSASSPIQVSTIMDVNGNGRNDLEDIRLITIRVVFESGKADKSGGYRPCALASSINPRNMQLLGAPGTSTSDTTIVLSANPAIIRADGVKTSSLTATMAVLGSPLSGRTVYCTLISGGGTVTPTVMTNNGNGTYSATYHSPTTTGQALIMAVDSAAAVSASTVIGLTAPPDSICVAADPDSIVADSLSTSTITATLFDSLGNQVAGETVTIEITKNHSGAAMQETVQDKGNGNYTRVYKASKTAGRDTVTATCGSLTASIPVTAIPGAARLQIWAIPDTLGADTSARVVIKLLVLSHGGDSLAGQPVSMDFDHNPAGASWVTALVDSGDGFYYRIMRPGSDSGHIVVRANNPPLEARVTVVALGVQEGEIAVGKVIKVKISDFQEDDNSDPDIFVAYKSPATELSVFLNKVKNGLGDLNNMDEKKFNALGEPVDMGVANMDSARTDVVLILKTVKRIQEAFNDLHGNFRDSSYTYAIAQDGVSGAVGDIDKDGDVDVIAGTTEKKTEVWKNDGWGHLTRYAKYSNFEKPNELCLVDLKEDTLKDLDIIAGTEKGELEVLFNDGGGNFHTDHVYKATEKVYALAAGDLNKDGYADIVCGTRAKKIEIWLNNGNGTFPNAPTHTYNLSGEILSVALGDVREDTLKDVDVAAGTKDGILSVWYNNGSAAFTKSSQTYSHSGKITGLDIGDLIEDSSGDKDIVAGTDEGADVGRIHLWLNDGDGTFTKKW
jgi:prepilin-type N-terminal cleavage/methylation domain-containing protein